MSDVGTEELSTEEMNSLSAKETRALYLICVVSQKFVVSTILRISGTVRMLIVAYLSDRRRLS